jgi:hypothetical protein
MKHTAQAIREIVPVILSSELGCTSASDVRCNFTQQSKRGLEIAGIIGATMVVNAKKRPIQANADIACPVVYVCGDVESENWYASTANSKTTRNRSSQAIIIGDVWRVLGSMTMVNSCSSSPS